MSKIKIVGISGSLRKNSYNTALLNNIKKTYNDAIDFEIVDISGIPFFSEDTENDYIESLENLKSKIISADAVLIASPEYNYSISGVLKNTLDFLSRGNIKVLENKKVAILSASLSPMGGARMQYDLRKILLCLNADVLRKPEIFVADAKNKFDSDGLLTDEKTEEFISILINNLVSKIENNKNSR